MILFYGCSTAVQAPKATRQQWFGGAAGSGGGTQFTVCLQKARGTKLQIIKVWHGNQDSGYWAKAYTIYDSSQARHTAESLAKASSFRLVWEERFPGERRYQDPGEVAEKGTSKITAPSTLPATFTDGAVIFYRLGNTGKERFLIVEEWKNLPPLAYP